MTAPDPRDFDWRSESEAPAPTRLSEVDDRLTADAALKRVRSGEVLRYTGDFHNARQLLQAMTRRLKQGPGGTKSRSGRAAKGKPPHAGTAPPEPGARSPEPTGAPSPALAAFRSERRARAEEHELLSRVVVALEPGYRLPLRRAPDVAQACTWAWGPTERPTLVPLKALLGVLSAAEWQRKGLRVPGLEGTLHPAYGVFAPTRHEYVDALLQAPKPTGKTVFDVGTGTGVLSFLLLQRGAARAVGTDVEERCVRCATDNAQHLGLADRYEARLTPLFPEGRADLVVCNPPWIPEPPKNRVDRAIFDEGGATLEGFLAGLADHLAPGGEGWLLVSNLGELLGLRPPGFLDERFAAHGLEVKWTKRSKAQHAGAHDRGDPLHDARSREVTTLYCLAPKGA